MPKCQDKHLFNQNKLPAFVFIVGLYPITDTSSYNKKNSIVVLQRIFNILEVSISALNCLKNKKLNQFDAHVGETACHIRACKTMYICQQSQSIYHIEQEIKNIHLLKNYLSTLKNSIINTKQGDLFYFAKSFKEFLPTFFQTTIYLTQCYFLNTFSKKNENNFPISICAKKYDHLLLSKKVFSDLVRIYQKNVSKESVQFMYKLSLHLNKDKSFLLSFNDSIKIGTASRHMVPLFSSLKLIGEYLRVTKQLIILRVNFNDTKEIILPLYYTANGTPTIHKMTNSQNPCYVIYGISSNLNLSTHSFFEDIKPFLKNMFFIDMNTAVHKQYVDNSNFIIPQEYSVDFKKAALISKFIGCTQKNNALFTIEHIYTDTFSNVIKISNDKNTFINHLTTPNEKDLYKQPSYT